MRNIFDQIELSNPQIKSKQGYSFLNHVSWHFTNAPRTTGIVGGDAFMNDLKSKMNNSSVSISSEFYQLIDKFNKEYQSMLEQNDYGNQITCHISKN